MAAAAARRAEIPVRSSFPAGSTPDEVPDAKSGIYIWSVDSKSPERITAGPQDTSPAWGPSQ